MLSVTVNGESKTIAAQTSIQDALTEWQFCDGKIAVAINQEFVPRSQYESHHIQDGDSIEILSPIQGG